MQHDPGRVYSGHDPGERLSLSDCSLTGRYFIAVSPRGRTCAHATYSPCSILHNTLSIRDLRYYADRMHTRHVACVQSGAVGRRGCLTPHALCSLAHALYTMHHVARPKSGVWGGGAARSPRMHSARARGGGGGGRLDERGGGGGFSSVHGKFTAGQGAAAMPCVAYDAASRSPPLPMHVVMHV